MGQSDFDKESEKIRNQIADIIKKRGGWDKTNTYFYNFNTVTWAGWEHKLITGFTYYDVQMLKTEIWFEVDGLVDREDFIKYIEAYKPQKLEFEPSSAEPLASSTVTVKVKIDDSEIEEFYTKIDKYFSERYDTSSNSK